METSCIQKVRDGLSAVSAGKYHTKLYHKGRSYQASWVGGLATLLLGLVIFLIALFTFLDVIATKNYLMQRSSQTLKANSLRLIDENFCEACTPVTVRDYIDRFGNMQLSLTVDMTVPNRTFNCDDF